MSLLPRATLHSDSEHGQPTFSRSTDNQHFLGVQTTNIFSEYRRTTLSQSADPRTLPQGRQLTLYQNTENLHPHTEQQTTYILSSTDNFHCLRVQIA